MNASFLVSPSLRGWFAPSELPPQLAIFVERLVRDGYSCRTARCNSYVKLESAAAMVFQVATLARTEVLSMKRIFP